MKIQILLAFTFLMASCSSVDEPLYIGVLEYNDSINARIAFLRDSSGWHSIKTKDTDNKLENELRLFPTTIKWNIYFDGKSLGELSSKYEKSPFYSKDGFMVLTGDQTKVPQIKFNMPFFYSWKGQSPYRPLVLVTRKRTNDVDNWKPATLDNDERSSLLNSFLKKLGGVVMNCKPYREGAQQVSQKSSIDKSKLDIVKVYKSSKGTALAAIKVKTKYECDGIVPEEYSIHWYTIVDNNSNFIGHDLSPVDAGDFDNDGKSEWIFQYSGYNEDGYVIFVDNFKKRIEFNWGYH